MSIIFIIQFKAKEERLHSFKGMMEEVSVALPRVEGCVTAAVYNSTQNPQCFTLVEAWESEQQHQGHVAVLQEAGVWDDLLTHLECEPCGDYYRALSAV